MLVRWRGRRPANPIHIALHHRFGSRLLGCISQLAFVLCRFRVWSAAEVTAGACVCAGAGDSVFFGSVYSCACVRALLLYLYFAFNVVMCSYFPTFFELLRFSFVCFVILLARFDGCPNGNSAMLTIWPFSLTDVLIPIRNQSFIGFAVKPDKCVFFLLNLTPRSCQDEWQLFVLRKFISKMDLECSSKVLEVLKSK